jgi:hypothetical protein
VILAWALATPLALFAAHRLLPRVMPRVLATQGLEKVAVIAGANDLGRRLAERLRDPMLGTRVAGYFDDRGARRLQDLPAAQNLGELAQLADYARAQRVDVIYIALPMASQPRILRLLEELRDTTASIYFVPDIFVADLIQARVDSIGGIPVVAACETPFYGFNGFVKRASDVIFGTAILLLAAPLMLAIALGVKLSSPGPILFKQRRYGLDGRKIVVYKFRSMTVAEDGDAAHQRAAGSHERGRAAAARGGAQRDVPQADPRLHDPAQGAARDHGACAGERVARRDRDGREDEGAHRDGPRLPAQLVARARPADHPQDARRGARPEERLLTESLPHAARLAAERSGLKR